jgi:hypothetical protein
VRARAADSRDAAEPPPAARDDREVEHEGGVREPQPAEVDLEAGLAGSDRLRQRLAAQALRCAVLIAETAQERGILLERDDGPT